MDSGEKVKLLYAEDELLTRKFYVKRLKQAGFEVTAVADGLQALNRYRAGKWDILLLDMDMPGMRGNEVIRLIRANGGEEPIVVLSGLNESDLMVLEEGADDFVLKGGESEVLISRLNRRLRDAWRRVTSGERELVRLSEMTAFDLRKKALVMEGKVIRLKVKEGKLMWMLAIRKNEDVPVEELCRYMWFVHNEGKEDLLSTEISKLRGYLKEDASLVLEKRGRCYRLWCEQVLF